jgi:hypothetical protein
VEKELRDAFDGTVDKVTAQQRKILVQRGNGTENNTEGAENKVTTSAAVREICSAEVEKKKQDASKNSGSDAVIVKRSAHIAAKPSNGQVMDDNYGEDCDDDEMEASSKKRSQPTAKALPARTANKPKREAAKAASAKFASTLSDDDLDFSDDDISVEEVKASNKKGKVGANATKARTTSAKRKAASESTKSTTRGRAISKVLDSDDQSDVDDDIEVVGLSGGKGWGISSQTTKRDRR